MAHDSPDDGRPFEHTQPLGVDHAEVTIRLSGQPGRQKWRWTVRDTREREKDGQHKFFCSGIARGFQTQEEAMRDVARFFPLDRPGFFRRMFGR